MEDLIFELLYVLGGVIVTAIGAALTKLTNAWANKTDSEYLGGLIRRLDDLAILVVTDINQSFRKPREKIGEWTVESKRRALLNAKGALKSYLGPKGIKELLKLVGGDQDALDALLESAVEGAVDRTKKLRSPA